jgi:hypothetical protein
MDHLCRRGDSRRDFMKKAATKAVWTAPALTLLVAASAQPAHAQHGYGGADDAQCGGLRALRRRTYSGKK